MKISLFGLCLCVCSGLLAAAPQPLHVALIFDDGPHPENTSRLLKIFSEEGVHVSFGTVGKAAEANPELLRKVVAAGHELTNHSYSHQHPSKLGAAELGLEVQKGQDAIKKAAGVSPVWYWAPYCAINDAVRVATAKTGIQVYPIDRLVVSGDYQTELDAKEIVRRATTGVKDGSVILFHEWREETITQMKTILAELKKQGCVFLSFSELARYNEKH